MKASQYLCFTLLALFVVVSGFLTDEEPVFLHVLKTKLKEYNLNYPEEKIYLQFDKPFYKPGDDIWFNAFILNANTHKPSSTSDVVYVELLDPKGNVASRLSLFCKEGSAPGDFTLEDTAPGGIYRIRAYTQWMKNFDDGAMFKKEIQVQRVVTPRLLLKLDFEKEAYGIGDRVEVTMKITNLKNEKVENANIRFVVAIAGKKVTESIARSNSNGETTVSFHLPDTLTTTDGLLQVMVSSAGVEESISRSIPIVLNKINIQFFPEGGHAVSETEATIAFRALNEFGKGADVSGIVEDDNGNKVTSFQSFHMGMGAFDMKVEAGKKYFAKITKPQGNEARYPLPTSLESGYTLRLKNATDANLQWTIYAPKSTPGYLVGQSHGEIKYTTQLMLHAGKNTINVPTEKFPVGIAAFTLFDNDGTERCERLVFLHKNKGLTVKLKTDKKQYDPREKVTIEIETTDHNGIPTPAKLSLAVVDDKIVSFANDKQDNILSAMLLSSEVRGQIQEPSFYFDPDEPKAERALDYLLMTQGWRRFTWSQVRDMNRPITYSPDKVNSLSGTVMHQGRGHQTEITLVELGNKRRIDKISTTSNGHFIFKNIDPTVPALLLVKKPGEISIQKEKEFAILLNDGEGSRMVSETRRDGIASVRQERKKNVAERDAKDFNVTLNEDVTELQEIVVTALGVETRNGLSRSSVRIYDYESELLSSANVAYLLQGRVAGVTVEPQMTNPSARAAIRIRGNKSLLSSNEPLLVVDGYPLSPSLNQNFSSIGIISPEDISSMEVMTSPEATALYGSAAANGVIIITTKSNLGYPQFHSSRKPAKYNGLTIAPRKFSATREFYVDPPPKNKSEKREDFRSTVYWNHTIVTDSRGEAKLSFYNSDATSAFRITAEGFSGSGSIGRAEEVYFTQLPVSLDVKLPEYIGFEDKLKLPVQIKNETSSAMTGQLKVNVSNGLSVDESITKKIVVSPGKAETFFFTVTSKGMAGKFPISIELETGKHQDKFVDSLSVHPVGYPVRYSFSSRDLDKTVPFAIEDAERGTLKAELTAYPDAVSDLFAGAEAILREPHGCFEQVSSSTFPNILALQLLQQRGSSKPDLESRAMRYIRSGYAKLAAYEIKGGGFEWFGHPPAHEGLTAYGLIEFHEMKKVFSGVDPEMVDRTKRWLMSRRDGNGGFKVKDGKYGFSGSTAAVNNAYIVYALAETGTTEIPGEYTKAYVEAMESKDMYRMALMANASHRLGNEVNYLALTKAFKQHVASNGLSHIQAESSIVHSYGTSLQTETVSLWTIALLRAKNPDMDLIGSCIKHIISQRKFGQFGSTQGTTLALKAMTEYARLLRSTMDDGDIQISINGSVAEKKHYEKDATQKITMTDFAKQLVNDGEQKIRVTFLDTREPIPYAVDVQWYTKKPQSDRDCKVSLTTVLSAATVRLNETVRQKIIIENKTREVLPMITAVIGIPAGMSIQPWQLKELQEQQVFDFYEIQNGNLNIYYRTLAKNESKTINLDLKAEIPGTFTGAASSAYLYYTNEHKDWVKGNTIEITQP